MSRHSLEKSLAILAPTLTSNKKVVSPVTVPGIISEEEDEEEEEVQEEKSKINK